MFHSQLCTKKNLTYLIKLQFQVRITRGHTQGDKETYVLILLQRIPTWEDQGEDHNPPDFPHQSVAMSSHYYLIWIKSCTIKPVLKRIQVNFENVCLFVNNSNCQLHIVYCLVRYLNPIATRGGGGRFCQPLQR